MFLFVLALFVLGKADQRDDFEQWTLKHGKTYDDAERELRFNVFKQNLVTAQSLQKQSPYATFGATKFADLTSEEFRAIYLTQRNNGPAPTVVGLRRESDVPTHFDWRTQKVITPVLNQGECEGA